MYRSFLLSQMAIAMLFCAACSHEKTLYCNRCDPTTIRIIPKREPFTAVTDSISFYTGQTINCLRNISLHMNLVQHKAMVYEMAALRNNSARPLLQYRSYYESFCQTPCNDSIYELYCNSYISLAYRLAEIRNLYFDVKDISCRKNLTEGDAGLVIRKIARYVNGKSEVFSFR